MKKTIVFITILTILGLFAACKKSDSDEIEITSDETEITSDEVEITLEDGVQYIEYANIKYRIDGDEATIIELDQYEKIHIPEKISSYPVTNVDDSCWFGYVSEERSFTVDSKNKRFLDDGNALYSGDKTKLYFVYSPENDNHESYSLPEEVTWIHKNAFVTAQGIKVEVDPDNKVFSVCNDSLYDESNKTLIYCFEENGVFDIPADAEKIEETALDSFCISYFNVDAGNKFFESHNGVLFRAGMKELVRCPMGADFGEYFIPEGTTIIESGAFLNCQNIFSIYLPDSISEIQDNSISFCDDLFFISVPQNVKYIGKDFLYNCGPVNNPTIVLYRGTQEDWEKIEFEDNSTKELSITTINDEAYERLNENFEKE